MPRPLLVLAALGAMPAAAACATRSPADCAYTCADNGGSCPGGFECAGGLCRAEGATGSCAGVSIDGGVSNRDGDPAAPDAAWWNEEGNLLWSGGFDRPDAEGAYVPMTSDPGWGGLTRVWYLVSPAGQAGTAVREAGVGMDGSAALALSGAGGDVSPWAQQRIAVGSLTVYELSAQVRCSAPLEPAEAPSMAARWFDTGMGFKGSDFMPTRIDVADAFLPQPSEVESPPDAAWLLLQIVGSSRAGVECDVDNVLVTPP